MRVNSEVFGFVTTSVVLSLWSSISITASRAGHTLKGGEACEPRLQQYAYNDDEAQIWEPRSNANEEGSSSYSKQSSDHPVGDNSGSTVFYHFLPEKDASASTSGDPLDETEPINYNEDLIGPPSVDLSYLNSRADKRKSRFFDTNKRRLNYIRAKLAEHIDDKDEIVRMIADCHPLVCHYERQYKDEQRQRDRKCKLRRQLEAKPDDVKLHMRILREYGETPQEFLQGRRPKGQEIVYTMSEKRRQAVRDVYRKLQRDVEKYNETHKTKQPYDLASLRAKKQESIDDDPDFLVYKEGNEEADEMVGRMQDLRERFCRVPTDATIVQSLIEMDAWMIERKFKAKTLILPQEFTRLAL